RRPLQISQASVVCPHGAPRHAMPERVLVRGVRWGRDRQLLAAPALDVVPTSERIFEMKPSGIWGQSPWIVWRPPSPWLERVENKAPCAVGVRRGEECRHRTTVEKPEKHGPLR